MCVLHVRSKLASFAKYLKMSRLPSYQSHEKGEISRYGKPYSDYGFSCIVSEKEWTDFEGQIEDAIRFLREHEDELRNLLGKYELDDIRLDFPFSSHLDEDCIAQFDYLPPELLKLAGNIGIGIELSHYVTEEYDGDPGE